MRHTALNVFLVYSGIFFLTTLISCKEPKVITIEAEQADYFRNARIEYSPQNPKEAFLSFRYELEPDVQWILNMPKDFDARLNIVYSNGKDKVQSMILNYGQDVTSEEIHFVPTTDYNTWGKLSVPIEFKQGMNIIRLSNQRSAEIILDRITISGNNTPRRLPPKAYTDYYKVIPREEIVLNPLANDISYQQQNMKVEYLGNPKFGSVVTDSSGKTRYRTNNNIIGIDTILYRLNDSHHSSEGAVIIETEEIDWSQEVVKSMLNQKSPETFGSWYYGHGLMLEGVYRTYKRTGEIEYLNFMQLWADRFINDDGSLISELHSLDMLFPGVVVLHLYEETGLEKYRLAAQHIRNAIIDYPRTSEGALWHNKKADGQLWLDGIYMSMTFLTRYGAMFGEYELYDEAINHFRIYYSHLYDEKTGLLFHAWDEDGSSEWASKPYNRSTQFWGRSMGWFTMALVECLEVIPEEHEGREDLIEITNSLFSALINFQDPETGIWYQVTDKVGKEGNWPETSCSAMYIYSFKRALNRGYIGEEFNRSIELGYNGMLRYISLDHNQNTRLMNTCWGTNIGDYEYYTARWCGINDNHGQGPFLIMNEEMLIQE